MLRRKSFRYYASSLDKMWEKMNKIIIIIINENGIEIGKRDQICRMFKCQWKHTKNNPTTRRTKE